MAKLQGKVTYWNAEKAFGFLRQDRGGADLFWHISGLVDQSNADDIQIGDRVSYQVEFDARKSRDRATEIELL